MKVFLSYKFGDNISGILQLLVDNHLDVFDSITDLSITDSFQRSIKSAIRNSDFVVVVYSQENTNISFETGIACALNKPIFAIISPEVNIQDYLMETTYVNARATELDKISFSFSVFLKNQKPKKASGSPLIAATKSQKMYGGGEIGPSDFFQLQFESIKNSQENYEAFFKQMFSMYHLNVTENIFKDHLGYADFSIWSDSLSNILGSPILVEIKKEITRSNIDKISDQVFKGINNHTASSFLIFYDRLSGLTKSELPNSSKSLYIQINDLLAQLAVRSFSDSIRVLRNQIVHNKL